MNRASRRMKHKLIEAPKGVKTPLQNIHMNPKQKTYTCICRTGFISISEKLPIEAFEGHVKSFTGREGSTQTL